MPSRVVRNLESLEAALDAIGAQRLMVVADAAAVRTSGADQRLAATIATRQRVRFEGFSPYPKYDEIVAGLDALGGRPVDAILAVGGGSAIDTAKLIAIAAPDPDHAPSILTNRRPADRPGLPVIAVPTTAGTGADATRFAAIYLEQGKASVAHDSMRPRLVVLDPALTRTMPPRLTAATGLDAMCQAIESIWSVRSTPTSTRLAVRALRLAWRYLPQAVERPTPRSRRAMLFAAHLAGRAIDITTTTACHAMSYELSGRFGVAHGHAVALTLSAMLRYNADVTEESSCDPRGPDYTRAQIGRIVEAAGADAVGSAVDAFDRLLERLGCERRLRTLGVKPAHLAGLAATVNPQRLSNNPRRLSHDDVRAIYESIL